MTDSEAKSSRAWLNKSMGESMPDDYDVVMEALKREGITTLEELVSRTLRVQRKMDDVLRPFSAAPNLGPEVEPPANHSTPKVPIFIDGVEYEPSDISRFNGTRLSFIVQKYRAGGLALHAFSDPRYLQTAQAVYLFLKPMYEGPGQPVVPGTGQPWPDPVVDWGKGGFSTPGAGGAPSNSTPSRAELHRYSVQMFSDIDLRGDWWWLDRGWQCSDLRSVGRNKVLFLHGDWNDVISSISETGGVVTYHEHINFMGSSMTVPAQTLLPNLVDLGWNDRISSVQYWA